VLLYCFPQKMQNNLRPSFFYLPYVPPSLSVSCSRRLGPSGSPGEPRSGSTAPFFFPGYCLCRCKPRVGLAGAQAGPFSLSGECVQLLDRHASPRAHHTSRSVWYERKIPDKPAVVARAVDILWYERRLLDFRPDRSRRAPRSPCPWPSARISHPPPHPTHPPPQYTAILRRPLAHERGRRGGGGGPGRRRGGGWAQGSWGGLGSGPSPPRGGVAWCGGVGGGGKYKKSQACPGCRSSAPL